MYIHTIDFLRGIAALMVVLVHFAGTGFLGESVIVTVSAYGQNGVIIFFVISGFIIPYALSKKNYSLNNFKEFIVRRLLRLNPPYYISVFLTIFPTIMFHNQEYSFSLYKILLHFTYLVPFTNITWYNNVYWTLAIEFQYYLIIGLLYPFLTKNKYITMFVLMVICFSNNLGFYLKIPISILNFTTPFVLGIVLFLYKIKFISLKETILNSIVILFLCKQQLSGTRMLFALFAYLCIFFVKFRSNITDFLGKISYSLYLTHTYFFHICYVLSEQIIDFSYPLAKYLFVVFLIPLSILFAYAFYKLVEEPSINLSKSLANNV